MNKQDVEKVCNLKKEIDRANCNLQEFEKYGGTMISIYASKGRKLFDLTNQEKKMLRIYYQTRIQQLEKELENL